MWPRKSTPAPAISAAQSLEPALPFANPRSVQELEQQLGEAPIATSPITTTILRPVRVMSHSSHSGLFLFLIGAAVVLWLVLRRRARAMGYPQYPGQYPGQYLGGGPPGSPPGYGPGYASGGYPGGYMPGGGPGIMGSVASGLALGAGVAAGEELVEHMMGSGNQGGGFVSPAEAAPAPDPNADMGGNDFGVNDPGSWDDNSGAGGGGWDDGGGGGDSGGGDGGGGWT